MNSRIGPMTIARIEHHGWEAGFSWKKTLLLVTLGVIAGVVLALALPLAVS